jgi:hypothetical protein
VADHGYLSFLDDSCVPLHDLFPVAPAPGLELCVIVPARDEAGQLASAIAALARQRDVNRRPLDPARYEVLVLANNCRDDTAAIARMAGRSYPWLRLVVAECNLPDGLAHVGTARRVLMDAAAERLTRAGARPGVIASTDADTIVAPTWLAATLREIAAGADAVGGRIVVEPEALAARDPGARVCHLRDVGYRWLASELRARLDPDPADPWPRHFQHFGPSLAVTVAAYRRAGGLPVQPALEDVALYRALRRIDARIRHSLSVRVTTSARQLGRTVFGFAVQLERWSALHAAGQPLLVESPQALEARIAAEQQLRAVWRRAARGGWWSPGEMLLLADQFGIDAAMLNAALAQPQSFGCLLERVTQVREEAGVWARRWPDVDISVALAGLRVRLAELRARQSVPHSFQQVEAVDLLTAAG